jgi:trehalose/maltose hydrolase-like predicted phosphorylase
LSPAIHASLFARAGRLHDAVHWLRVAADVDIADVTGTTAGGLHVATMGGVWQALVWGFAGVRPRADALAVDPRLPDEWDAYEVRVQFRGVPVRVRVAHDGVRVASGGPITVHAGGTDHRCGPDGLTLPLPPLPPLPDAASSAAASNGGAPSAAAPKVSTLLGGAHAVRARRHR